MSTAVDSSRSARGKASRTRGARRELAVRDWYRAQGWEAHKTSRSEGVDVIVSKGIEEPAGELHGAEIYTRRTLLFYVEVKSTVRPYSSFPPSERKLLLDQAERAGAQARLFHWPKGVPVSGARIYKPEEWPEWVAP